jgi:hypothetical protein
VQQQREAEGGGDDDGDGEGGRKRMEESVVRQELRRVKDGQEEGTLNIAPRKPDWDLKR